MHTGWSMVPTARKKMQNFIQRHDSAPPPPPPPPGLTSPRPQAAQLAASPVIARREIPEAVKLPLPKPGRYAPASQPDLAALPVGALTPAPLHPVRRSRTNSDHGREKLQLDKAESLPGDTASQPEGTPRRTRSKGWDASSVGSPRPQRGELAARWEEQSTVGTLFSDSEVARSVTDRNRTYDRRRGDGTVQRLPSHRHNRPVEEPHMFIIGENGHFHAIDTKHQEPAPLAATNGKGGMVAEMVASREDPFRGASPGEQRLKKSRTLSRTKFPLRNGEDVKRTSFPEQLGMSPKKAPGASPEPYDSAGDAADALRREKEQQELEQNRSTLFHDVDDQVMDADSSKSFSSQGDEIEALRTPRPPREHKIPRQVAPPPKAALPPRPQKPAASSQAQKPAASSRKVALQESSLARQGSGREPRQKRRRLSLDYDDAALSGMDYASLREEAFDHDPAREAVQTAREPSGDSLEEKLRYYKGKDENSQHQFFTQVSVPEWEECGDWFLEQFGDVMRKMKKARQAKRQMVDRYEQEIAARADAVRVRAEGIEHTLGDLKKDGEVMMQGKEVEDD